jgi:mannose-1-phosphate guanylyltransferase/phosphomannomutase
MKAFVFVDRLGLELAPLNEQYCVAMLPIAGKPVLAYTIDELAQAGLREAVIIACQGARELSDYLGKGERWGMHFEYFPSRGEENPAELLARYGRLSEDPFIVLRGDVLRNGIGTFIELAAAASSSVVKARINGVDTGLCLCRGRDALSALSTVAPTGAEQWVDLDEARYAPLDSLADLHRASLDVAAGLFEGFILAGWQRRSGLVVGPGSHLEDTGIEAQHSYIGKGCRVHAKAELAGSVVIDDRCFIDRGARIENSVILPGTYVGENLHVNNALVCGQQIMRVDSGASYTVTDPFLLSTMQSDVVQNRIKGLGNRLLGLLALLLSLPLWPLAAVMALMKSPAKPLYRRVYISNKRHFEPGLGWQTCQFTGWHWQVRAPILRYLPLLLAVVGGHLKLWGTRPRALDSGETGTALWDNSDALTSAGLLGPVQLVLPLDAPSEECFLAELQYSHGRSVARRLFYLRKAFLALFNARAWVGPR